MWPRCAPDINLKKLLLVKAYTDLLTAHLSRPRAHCSYGFVGFRPCYYWCFRAGATGTSPEPGAVSCPSCNWHHRSATSGCSSPRFYLRKHDYILISSETIHGDLIYLRLHWFLRVHELVPILHWHAGRVNGLGHFRRILRILLHLRRYADHGAVHLLVRPLVSNLEVTGGLGWVLEQISWLVRPSICLLALHLGDLVLAPEVPCLLGPWL